MHLPLRGRPRRRDPLQRLRLRLIAISMASVTVALLLIFAAVNLLNYRETTAHVDFLIETIHVNGGTIPKMTEDMARYQVSKETSYKTRYFIVTFDAEDAVTSADISHIASVDRDEAGELAARMLGDGRDQGYLDQYRYHVYRDPDGGGAVIALDCYGELAAISNLTAISGAVMGGCAIVTLAIIVPVSKRALRPYVRNLERQRRFVTDASHELKTPVAIITANTDLLEAISGENQWTRSTHKQAARLSELIGDLIALARADEPVDEAAFAPVDLSAAVERELEDFAPLAEASGRTMTANVDAGVTVPGDPEDLERLVSVLLDNAIKHGDEGGEVEVTLTDGRREVQLCVANPCSTLEAGDIRHLFDRFWRPDASRVRATGGSGIGLSIARSVAERHGGRISARKVGGDLEIRVALPRARASEA